MSIPDNINLTDDAIDIVPHQFYDKVGVTSLLSAFTTSLQGSNDTVFNVLDSINLDDATGYLLDCVGSYLAVGRRGDTDEIYRPRILRTLLGAASEGTPNNLLENLAAITKGNTTVWEHYPVSTFMETTGKIIPNTLAQDMQLASPVTSGDITICINPNENTFRTSELGFDTVHLIDKNRDHFVTNVVDEHIVINDLNFGGVDEANAKLSEYTYGQGVEANPAAWDNVGILCEISHKNGGVTSYNYEYAQIDNSVNQWYNLMNFEIPSELI